MKTEPVLTVTAITSAITAIITALALTWPALNDYEQPIVAVVVAVYPIVTAIWARSKVSPVAKVEQDRYRRASVS